MYRFTQSVKQSVKQSTYGPSPHLDGMFTELFKPVVTGRKSKGSVEAGVWKSRYDNGMKDVITMLTCD